MIKQSSLKSSHIYTGLAVVIALVALCYGLLQYRVMNAQAAAIEDNQQISTQLNEKNKKLLEYYGRFAQTQDGAQKRLQDSLNAMIPVGENYTDLTRSFDNFFALHDSALNPIVQNSLRFGKGEPVAGMPNISALPITMNIEGTRQNFFAFLEAMNNSGTLSQQFRLIAINSIQLNFPDGGEVLTNQRQVINVTLELTAYYRNK